MKIKRALRAAVPLIGTIAIAGPFGFPPIPVLLGIALSVLTYYYWEPSYAAGEKVYRVVQDLRLGVRITEEKQPSTPPRPMSKDPLGTKTEPIGHNDPTVALDPDAALDADIEELDAPEPDFIIGTTEPSRPGAGDGCVVTLPKITSLGVGGVPGSGKTVAVVGLCTQAVPKYKGNVRFLVIDPHMLSGSEDALSARMAPLAPFYLNVENLPNPVSGGADLLKWMVWLTQQAKGRIGGRVDQAMKLVVVADEFTALMDDEEIAGPLTELLLLINEQARKVGMFALVASPQWKSSRTQGTEVRNTIASFLVHNMPPNIARQVIPNSAAELANTLAVGQAIFSSFGKIEIVRVPFMTPADIRRCTKPYLPPVMEPLPTTNLVIGLVGVPNEPGIAEVRRVWEVYQMVNRDLNYTEENAITAVAIKVYGPEDPRGEEKVRKALKLGEEYL